MAKFNLSTDKMIIVGGVLTTIKAGEHEITNKEIAEKLSKATGVTEVKPKAPKAQVKAP